MTYTQAQIEQAARRIAEFGDSWKWDKAPDWVQQQYIDLATEVARELDGEE